MSSRYSRRRLLKSGLATCAVFAAGCLGESDGDTGRPNTTDVPADSPIQRTEFEASDLVVYLRDDHDVSRLNLIKPDGSLYAGTGVATGATTARIKILDIQPGVGGYEHYEPGTYELVAVQAAGSKSIHLELRPELRIVAVQQYRNGDRPSDLGKLAVTVENVGSGPTWVYDITYQDAPNFAVNNPLGPDPGVPEILQPQSHHDLIIYPRSKVTFVGNTSPIVFPEDSESKCEGIIEFSVIVGSPNVEVAEVSISVNLSGTKESVGLLGEYACSEIVIKHIESAGGN